MTASASVEHRGAAVLVDAVQDAHGPAGQLGRREAARLAQRGRLATRQRCSKHSSVMRLITRHTAARVRWLLHEDLVAAGRQRSDSSAGLVELALDRVVQLTELAVLAVLFIRARPPHCRQSQCGASLSSVDGYFDWQADDTYRTFSEYLSCNSWSSRFSASRSSCSTLS